MPTQPTIKNRRGLQSECATQEERDMHIQNYTDVGGPLQSSSTAKHTAETNKIFQKLKKLSLPDSKFCTDHDYDL